MALFCYMGHVWYLVSPENEKNMEHDKMPISSYCTFLGLDIISFYDNIKSTCQCTLILYSDFWKLQAIAMSL